MNKTPPLNLSPEGRSRRAAMLRDLESAVHKNQLRRRRQRIVRFSVLAVLLLAVPLALSRFTARNHQPITNVNSNDAAVEVKKRPSLALETALVHSRPEVERYVVNSDQIKTSLVQFEVISDGHLEQLLVETGQPALVGRIDGKMTVISSDEEADASF